MPEIGWDERLKVIRWVGSAMLAYLAFREPPKRNSLLVSGLRGIVRSPREAKTSRSWRSFGVQKMPEIGGDERPKVIRWASSAMLVYLAILHWYLASGGSFGLPGRPRSADPGGHLEFKKSQNQVGMSF